MHVLDTNVSQTSIVVAGFLFPSPLQHLGTT